MCFSLALSAGVFPTLLLTAACVACPFRLIIVVFFGFQLFLLFTFARFLFIVLFMFYVILRFRFLLSVIRRFLFSFVSFDDAAGLPVGSRLPVEGAFLLSRPQGNHSSTIDRSAPCR